MTSRLNVCLLLALLILVGGCSDNDAHKDNPIRMGLANLPTHFDPRFATDATSERFNELLYSRLVDLDESLQPQPDLAIWQKLSNTHYRFTLQKRRHFDDGTVLTVDDVLTTYRFVLDQKNLSPHRQPLAHISNMIKRDAQTFDVLLTTPDPMLPALMTLGIVPTKAVERHHDFRTRPLGSGVYRLINRPTPQTVLLQRKQDGQYLELQQVKEPLTRVLKLLRKELDLLQNDLPPELSVYLQQQASIKTLTAAGSNFTYMGTNLQDPLTGDIRIRRAIAHAVDRQAIIDFVFNGAARSAESILPASHWAANAQLQAHAYDLDRAKALLLAAGFDEQRPLRLTYKTSSDPFRIKLASIIQAQLAKANILIEIKSYDWGTFFGDIKKGNFQLYSLSWVGIKTPEIYRRVFHSGSLPPAGANRGRYNSSSVDQWLDQIEQTDVLSERAMLYQRIQSQVHTDLPYIPLWYENQNAYILKDIKGYQLFADGNYSSLERIWRVHTP